MAKRKQAKTAVVEPMGKLSAVLQEIIPNLRVVDDLPDTTTAEPSCPVCQDAGWIRRERADLWEQMVQPCPACDLVMSRRIARILGRGGLPERAATWTFATFPVSAATQSAYDRVQAWAENTDSHASLLLHGPYGIGKTSLAVSAFRYRIEQGLGNGFFSTVQRLLAKIKRTYDRDQNIVNESEWEVLEAINECALLVLDDLGAERETEWAIDKLASIIAHRHAEEKPTIFTSNYDMDGLEDRLGERTFWRVKEMCWPNVIAMTSPNLRA